MGFSDGGDRDAVERRSVVRLVLRPLLTTKSVRNLALGTSIAWSLPARQADRRRARLHHGRPAPPAALWGREVGRWERRSSEQERQGSWGSPGAGGGRDQPGLTERASARSPSASGEILHPGWDRSDGTHGRLTDPHTRAPVCDTGDGRAELLPMVTKLSARPGLPTDKRHRIVNSVGNDPTEAPFRAIGMFPSHQLGNSPIEFSGPSIGLLPRRICQKSDLKETIPCLRDSPSVETPRPSRPPDRRDPPTVETPRTSRDPPTVGTPCPPARRAAAVQVAHTTLEPQSRLTHRASRPTRLDSQRPTGPPRPACSPAARGC